MDTPEEMDDFERLHDLVAGMDGIEQGLGDGPCLQALRTGMPVLLDDVSSDARWPRLRQELAGKGFGSVLGVPLDLGKNASAALDFFTTDAGVFTGEAISAAEHFAEVAARALCLDLRIAAAELHAEDLTAAMDHRTATDMARGIIMDQNRCTGEEAFDVLRRVSSGRNQKLHDVAPGVVSGVAGTAGAAYFEP